MKKQLLQKKKHHHKQLIQFSKERKKAIPQVDIKIAELNATGVGFGQKTVAKDEKRKKKGEERNLKKD